MTERPTIVVMGKLPEAGRVKTRLCPPLTHAQAASVHSAFLRETLRRASELAPTVWCFDPPTASQAAAEAAGRAGATVDLLGQSPGDLGDRLVAAARQIDGPLLFLGCDSPDLPAAHLDTALNLPVAAGLRPAVGSVEPNVQTAGRSPAATAPKSGEPTVDIVLGPCDDGGFWCMGVAGGVDLRPVLKDVEWSSGRELGQVRENARAAGLGVGDAPAWRDVDRAGGLATLWATLRPGRLRDDLADAAGADLLDRIARDYADARRS